MHHPGHRSIHWALNFLTSRVLYSLVPRPFEKKKGPGLLHIAHACAGFSMVTSPISIVTCPGSTVIWTVNGRIYKFPQFFWGPLAHACTRPFLSSKGLGTRLSTYCIEYCILEMKLRPCYSCSMVHGL